MLQQTDKTPTKSLFYWWSIQIWREVNNTKLLQNGLQDLVDVVWILFLNLMLMLKLLQHFHFFLLLERCFTHILLLRAKQIHCSVECFWITMWVLCFLWKTRYTLIIGEMHWAKYNVLLSLFCRYEESIWRC